MLDEEKDAVNAYIKEYNIQVISLEEFEKDTVTDVAKNEYVAFSNGVYMQIVDKGAEGESNKFVNNNVILARFVEVDILEGDTTLASTVCNPLGPNVELYPDGFRYTESGTSIYGQFLSEPGLAGWAGVNLGMGVAYGTSVPAGWLLSLKYIRNGAHVKLIVPSKMGHQIAQQKVYPYFYDVRKFSIYY